MLRTRYRLDSKSREEIQDSESQYAEAQGMLSTVTIQINSPGLLESALNLQLALAAAQVA